MEIFTIKHENGYVQVNIKNYFIKAGLPSIKTLFKLARVHCTEKQKAELLSELVNVKAYWKKMYQNGKNRYSYSMADMLTASTEKQSFKQQDKLDRIMEILETETWKR